MIYLADRLNDANWPQVGLNGGRRWVMARPVCFPSLLARLRAAWMVFTRKADVVVWEGQ